MYNRDSRLPKNQNSPSRSGKEKTFDNVQEDYSRLPEENPNPVLRYGVDGTLNYANEPARRLIRSKGNETAKESIRVGVNETGQLKQLIAKDVEFDDRFYTFTFSPSPTAGSVNVYGLDITEHVLLKQHFEVLSGFSTALLKADNDMKVAQVLAREAIARLGYVDFMVFLYHPPEKILKAAAGHGPHMPRDLVAANLEISLGEGIVGTAAARQSTIIVNDLSRDHRYRIDDMARASEISVPILAGGELIGVIDSEHHEKNHFTDYDRRILEAVAGMAATRIQHNRALVDRRITEEQFKNFVENAFGGIYILRNEHFEYVNLPFCDILGYDEAELLDPHFNVRDTFLGSDEEFDQVVSARQKGDYSRKSYHIRIRSGKGENKYVAINTTVLEDDRGKYTLGIALDVTDWMNSKKRLEEVNEELASRNDELREFAHLASHNLRAPVTNLMGLLQYYNYDKPEDPSNAELITNFHNSVSKLNLILDEMHTVLKVKSERSGELKNINLNQVLENVKVILHKGLQNSKLSIKTEFKVENLEYIESHLTNIFLNMITNAVKYRDPAKKPFLIIRSSETEEGVNLEFEDNGIGIDLETHGPKMFQMYRRFHSEPEGRGLGLYLIKKQLDNRQGRISVTSTVGEGTTFYIFLPTAANEDPVAR